MALRSHVDPVLYSRFILLDESDLKPEYVVALKASGNSTEVHQLIQDIFRHHPRVAFHEAYHCFQGIRTPFLHYYALVAWYAFRKVFWELCHGSEDHRTWQVEVPLFGLLAQKIQCTRPGGKLVGQPLTILDVVEGITSLIEWQLYARERSQSPWDIALFQRWQKRNAMYSRLYDVASDFIGPQRALLSTIALGTAALYTSKPVHAYNRMLIVLANGLSSSKFRRDFDSGDAYIRSEVLFGLLNRIKCSSPPDNTPDLTNDLIFRLRPPFDSNLLQVHPFFAHSAQNSGLFSTRVDEKTGFMALVHPELLSNIGSLFEDRFVATMTVIKVRLRDGTFWSRGMVHPQYAEYYIKSHNQENTAQTLVNFVRFHSVIASVVRRASGRFYTEQRTCELRACPEWPHNFCSAYTYTPSDYTKCNFLLDLEQLRKGLIQ